MLSLRIRWLLALLVLPACALAQQDVHRCVGADGNPVFTDQPCAAQQATPVGAKSNAASPRAVQDASPTAPESHAPLLCAANMDELRQGVVDAFATRDPNRLAGLVLWGGQGQESVVAGIRSMNALMQHTLLNVDGGAGEPSPARSPTDDIYDLSRPPEAESPPKPPAAPPAQDRQIVVRTASNDGSGTPQETRFMVVRKSGCLWLRPSG